MFLVTSVVFYICGFLSGYFCRIQRIKKVPDETSSHDQEIQDSPCYDDIHVIQGQQELELKENTAYGLLQ